MEEKIYKKSIDVENSPVKPDGGYGWVILFVGFTVSFILDGSMYAFGIIKK